MEDTKCLMCGVEKSMRIQKEGEKSRT